MADNENDVEKSTTQPEKEPMTEEGKQKAKSEVQEPKTGIRGTFRSKIQKARDESDGRVDFIQTTSSIVINSGNPVKYILLKV